MRRVYLETSVWSMVVPGQNPLLQEPTLLLLDQCSARMHMPFISDVVSEEVGRAPSDVKKIIVSKIDAVDPEVLGLAPEIEALATRFIAEGVLQPGRADDARHVACALVYELDWLVSWNYRHIANVRKAEAFNAIAVLSGFAGELAIHTPLEVLEWE